MRLVAADIGGTSSRFAIASITGEQGSGQVLTRRYPSAQWPDFNALYRHCLSDNALSDEQIDLLVLALPGVIHGKHARLTNLPWSLDSDRICSDFPVSRVVFINDFPAAANGLSVLTEGDLLTFNPAARPPPRPRGGTGAGTGGGVAYMVGVGRGRV